MSEMDRRVTNPRFVDAINRVMVELRKRGAIGDYCQRCNANDWNADLIRISASPEEVHSPQVFMPYTGAQSYIPTLTLTCKNCGNTLFHNLHVLKIAI